MQWLSMAKVKLIIPLVDMLLMCELMEIRFVLCSWQRSQWNFPSSTQQTFTICKVCIHSYTHR